MTRLIGPFAMPPPYESGTSPKPTDSRERLLDAGAELFARKGFHGTGLSEILERASVPKGSFYHHFGSKEEFAVVLIDRTRDGYLADLRPILGDRKLTPQRRLRAIFEHCLEHVTTDGPHAVECLITKLALETAQLSDSVHAAVKAAYQQWNALVAQTIREGQAAGEIVSTHDADRLASVLTMLWEGALMRMQIDRATQPLDDFLTFVFDSVLSPAS